MNAIKSVKISTLDRKSNDLSLPQNGRNVCRWNRLLHQRLRNSKFKFPQGRESALTEFSVLFLLNLLNVTQISASTVGMTLIVLYLRRR